MVRTYNVLVLSPWNHFVFHLSLRLQKPMELFAHTCTCLFFSLSEIKSFPCAWWRRTHFLDDTDYIYAPLICWSFQLFYFKAGVIWHQLLIPSVLLHQQTCFLKNCPKNIQIVRMLVALCALSAIFTSVKSQSGDYFL